jgi:hypothetical protein
MSDNIPEVNAQRRRRSSSKPTGQAEAPSRRRTSPRPSSGSGSIGMTPPPGSTGTGGFDGVPPSTGSSGGLGGFPPSGGGSYGSSPMGGLGGLASLLGGMGASGKRRGGCGGIIGIILLLVVLFFIIRSCQGGGSFLPQMDNGEQYYEQPTQDLAPVQPVSPTATRWPTAVPSSNSGKTWLVMLYQNADDNALERDILIDFNEAEMIGSTDQVIVVSQLDRYRGGFSGDGDWSSTRRYLVTYDNDLNRIGSELIADIGEVNMGDANTLVDFVSWAASTYPADNHVLIMSDHGMGWPGGWSDSAPSQRDNSSNAPLTSVLKDDILYLNEIEDALKTIQANTNIDKFELIGMDACLMSQMEVYAALAPYAKYAVASEETEPGLGWAYSAFLSLLVYDPDTPTADLAANIVDSYITQDQRVVDDQARAEFLAQNSSGGGWFVNRMSADQLANQLQQNITLTAVNLENYQGLVDALNEFAYQLQRLDQRLVAQARSYTQSYTSIFGQNVPPSFIDLGHFIQLIYKNTNDSNVRAAAEGVINALNQTIIAEKHGPSKPGSTGIAIYYPNSQLYSTAATGMQSYTRIASSFSSYSLWDDFLGYHYAGRQFQKGAATPVVVERASQIPGLGGITADQITASAQTVSPGQSVSLSAVLSGENIGYIYLFTGLMDKESNSVWVADMDYLESPNSESENGVYYPVWPQAEQFRLNLDFEPIAFTITDGEQEVLALFSPISYGANPDEAIYAVEGTYTFADTGETRKAQLWFKGESLFQVYGFVGSSTTGAPSEIAPQVGDTFTVSHRWMDLDANGAVKGISNTDGDTITFTGKPLSWGQTYLPSGTYLIGFLVADHDGNVTPIYTEMTVK